MYSIRVLASYKDRMHWLPAGVTAPLHVAVLQVYTYTLNPLIAGEEPDSTNGMQQQQQQRDLPPLPPRQQQQAPPLGPYTSAVAPPRSQSTVSGWELRLVMEFCDQVRVCRCFCTAGVTMQYKAFCSVTSCRVITLGLRWL
jgi:hypothetical protein